ncbi:hypothetical protein TgHK011_006060 [Trichoderma gracile]|nr:hypothetical protein TgHK011_006060 [Trichoderma gracile]
MHVASWSIIDAKQCTLNGGIIWIQVALYPYPNLDLGSRSSHHAIIGAIDPNILYIRFTMQRLRKLDTGPAYMISIAGGRPKFKVQLGIPPTLAGTLARPRALLLTEDWSHNAAQQKSTYAIIRKGTQPEPFPQNPRCSGCGCLLPLVSVYGPCA